MGGSGVWGLAPDGEERGRVVVHVQEADLVVVLLGDHDHGVHELVGLQEQEVIRS